MKKTVRAAGIALLLALAALSLAGGAALAANSPVSYRAILVGNWDYAGTDADLTAPGTDVAGMAAMLRGTSQYGGAYDVNTYGNISASALLSAVGAVGGAADENDVTLFYYSGHGMTGGALYCVDGNAVTIAQLESALDAVSGTKIVILDCCYSGGALTAANNRSAGNAGAEEEEALTEEQIRSALAGYTEAVVAAFEAGENVRARALDEAARVGDYIVIAASRYDQTSLELSSSQSDGSKVSFGLMTYCLTNGCGYDYAAGALTDSLAFDADGDGRVTISEVSARLQTDVDTWLAKLNGGSAQYAQNVQTYATRQENSTVVARGVTGIAALGDISLSVGASASVTAVPSPSSAVNKRVTWASDNEAAVRVTGLTATVARVTGVAPGTARVTATTVDGGYEAAFTVTVRQAIPTGVSLPATLSLRLGDGAGARLTPVYNFTGLPSGAAWTSSAPEVASVDAEGNVLPLSEGTASVSVSASDGAGGQVYSASCAVTVYRVPVASLSLSRKEAKLDPYEGALSLSCEVLPADASDSAVLYASSNPAVATVDERGRVLPVAAGQTTVTAASRSDPSVTDICVVTVKRDVSSVTLDVESLTLYEGETYLLAVDVLPETASYRSVAFAVEGAAVSVDSSGLVRALAKGEATVIATADGQSARCAVTVRRRCASVALSLNGEPVSPEATVSMEVGESLAFEALAGPSDADDRSVLWSVSDGEIASVSGGVLTPTGAKTGLVTLTAATADGGATASARIWVRRLVRSISLSVPSATLYMGDTLDLGGAIAVLPADADDASLVWTTSDSSVATVQNGVVSPVGNGTAQISAAPADGGGAAPALCAVTVATQVASASFAAAEISLNVGESLLLEPIAWPETASDKGVRLWESGDESVVTVSPAGLATAVGPGSATVTAHMRGGDAKAECLVTVRLPAEGVALTQASLTLYLGEGATLGASVRPEGTAVSGFAWSSDNPGVATVDGNGAVLAISAGMARVRATEPDGLFAECVVECREAASGLSLALAPSVTMNAGETLSMGAAPVPASAYDRRILYASADESLARVSADGVITALAPTPGGPVRITASLASNGATYEAEVLLTIERRADGVSLSPSGATLGVGETLRLSAEVSPADATDKSVTWRSGNPAVAAVDETGLVTARSGGSAVITATANDGGFTASVGVSVCEMRLEAGAASLWNGQETRVFARGNGARALVWTATGGCLRLIESDGGQSRWVAFGEGTATVTAAIAGTNVSASVTLACRVSRVPGAMLVSPKAVEIARGETAALSLAFDVGEADYTGLLWHTSDAGVAAVSAEGVVTAVGRGEARIWATARTIDYINGARELVSSACAVRVAVYPQSVRLSEPEGFTLKAGETRALAATVVPADADGARISWKSSAPSVATVSGGLVKAVAPGRAVVTAETDGGRASASVEVTVVERYRAAQSLRLSQASLTLCPGLSTRLTLSVTPADSDEPIVWASSDSSVVSVDGEGRLRCAGLGSAVITASASGASASCAVRVVEKSGVVAMIRLDASEKTVAPGGDVTLRAALYAKGVPANAAVEWTVSDASVAALSPNGAFCVVRGRKAGSAVVTATASSGVSASCTVRVANATVAEVRLNVTKKVLERGETLALRASVSPSAASGQPIFWSTSDASIVTVDANGLATGVGEGYACVYATAPGGASAVCKLYVRSSAPAPSPEPSPAPSPEPATPSGAGEIERIVTNRQILTLSRGQIERLAYSVLPEGAVGKLSFTSSNPEIVAVTQSGYVKGRKAGKAIVTVTAPGGAYLRFGIKVR